MSFQGKIHHLVSILQLRRRRGLTMELSCFINLTFIFALNVLFFFSGICLNYLVILSFWRSVQLRKKLCYFMIMVLSCCDLLAVLTNHPLVAVTAMLWLTGKLDRNAGWVSISFNFASLPLTISLLALLVMNFDLHLATYYPIKHRTSVMKRKLLTLLGIMTAVIQTLGIVSLGRFISHEVYSLIVLTIVIPPMIFINYKLFRIARKNRENKGISSQLKRSFSSKNISSVLLAVACFAVLSISAFVYIVQEMTSKTMSSHVSLARLWAKTIVTMNSTFNCLIFYWKNKTLCTQGIKIIKP